MATVTGMLNKEIQNINDQKAKREKDSRSIKERMLGMSQNPQEGDEIRELESKLDSMEIPEEAKQIYKREIKKLKQLGPRN